MSGQGSGSGGPIIIRNNVQNQDHSFTADELAEIISHLPDGDLKTRLQAILDSLT